MLSPNTNMTKRNRLKLEKIQRANDSVEIAFDIFFWGSAVLAIAWILIEVCLS